MKRKIQQFRLYMVGLAVFLFGGIAWAATNTELWPQLQSVLLNAEELSVIYGNPEDEDPTGTTSVAVTLGLGNQAYACTVNEKEGIKVGTATKTGYLTITIPANTTKLTFYAAAWKGVSDLSLHFSGDTDVSFSIDVTDNDGITGNPPFTLSEGTIEDDYKYVLELNDITSETTFSVSAEKRFVIWGASAEVASEEPNPNPNGIAEPKKPTPPQFEGNWVTPEVGGTYYIYNVGAGQFLGCGQDWGTRAITTSTQLVKLNDPMFTTSSKKDAIIPFKVSLADYDGDFDGPWYLIERQNVSGGSGSYLCHEGNAVWIDGSESRRETEKNGYWRIEPQNDGYSFNLRPHDVVLLMDEEGEPIFDNDWNEQYVLTDRLFGLYPDGVSTDYAYTWADIANDGNNYVNWRFVSADDADYIEDFINAGVGNEEYKEALAVYEAKLELYQTLLEAYDYGIDYSAALSIYNDDYVSVADVNAANIQLQLLIRMDGIEASEENPVEFTELIKNSDFSTGNTDGWKTNYESGKQASNIGCPNFNYENGDIVINQFFEAWKTSSQGGVGDGYIQQTIYGLPAGVYRLECDAVASRQSDSGIVPEGVYLFAQSGYQETQTALATESGLPEHFVAEFDCYGEDAITFGLKTENATANWIAIDNFKLYYLGDETLGKISFDLKQSILSGSPDNLTLVQPETPFVVAVSARGLGDINPDDLMIHFDMVMVNAYLTDQWNMSEANRIILQDVSYPYSSTISFDGFFTEKYPYIQSIVLAGAKLMNNGEVIAAIDDPIQVNWIEVEHVVVSPEYAAALESIESGAVYRIKADVDGTTYYLKADGTITPDEDAATGFTITTVSGGQFYDMGFFIDGGGTRFSNPPGTQEYNLKCGRISTSSDMRPIWEAQVLFLNEDGKYAVRATNVAEGATSGWSWVANSYWTVEWSYDYDDYVAQYDWDPAYIWEFEYMTSAEDNAAREAAAELVQSWIPFIQTAKGLVKDAGQWYSNAKERNEGSYAALIDGDNNTYFHSMWSSGADDYHYLQAELPDAVQQFRFYFKKRSQNNNNRPTVIGISASNDGENFDEFEYIEEGLPTEASAIDYFSDEIDLGEPYKYIRFTVYETNNGSYDRNGFPFFSVSEFYILPTDIPEAAAAYDIIGTPTYQLDVDEVLAVDSALKEALKVVYVTYALYDEEGTLLMSKQVLQDVNSDIMIPAEFMTVDFYKYEVIGEIGEEDCEIQIVRSFKDGIIASVEDLNPNKAYTISCQRGSFFTMNNHLYSTGYSEFSEQSPSPFAIISYNDNNYLYSVNDRKFVTCTGELAKIPVNGVNDAIYMEEMDQPYVFCYFSVDGNDMALNTNGNRPYGYVINSWMNPDAGNQYCFVEAVDFDPAEILAAMEENIVKNENYNRALNSIEGGAYYRISTEVDGAPYYLNTKGYLTDKYEEAAIFIADQMWSENQGEYGYAYMMESNERFFTSASGLDEQAMKSGCINQTARGNYLWDAQVFFMNEDGKYAVRSTNVSAADSLGLVGSAYWTVDQTENDPVAQYSFDENYIWNLEKVEQREVYCHVLINGNEWMNDWAFQFVGATPVAPEWFYEELRGLYTLTPNVDVITEETDEVYFTATWNGPFKFSESYENAKWYNMTIRRDYYVAMDATEPYYPSVDKELEVEESLWAFLPDENDPFRVRVINHAAGPDMNLAQDGDYAVMRDYEFYWNIYGNNDGFVLSSEWDDGAWINQYGSNKGYLGFWYSWSARYDEGSTFRVNETEYNEFLKTINVRGKKTLELAGKQIPVDYRPDVNVMQAYDWVGNSENPTTLGALNIIATDTTELNVNNLTMSFYPAQTNYFRNQWNTPQRYYTPQHTTLIADGPVSAEAITIRMALTDGQWNFITVPYDVRVSDIYCENEETDWVIRRYDGQARANMQMDATWINVGADEILEPGKGYIMHCSYSPNWLYSSQTFYFPALNTKNKNLIFSDEDRLVPLNEYESEFAHNSSWNLIGNPYAAYVEIGATDFNSPITVWDGTGNYLAYSPIDDEYILSPGEAFFVQRPAGQSAIIFDAESRMSWYDTQKGVRYAKSQLRKSNPNRHVFNLFLSDGEQSDRTRVVINPDAAMAYENSCDAAKFPAMKRNTTQIYSIASGVDYSINERPLADGTVQLAARFAKTGQYTLRMETSADYSVILTDEATGIAMELNSVDGYTFDALAGDANNRFRLQISKDADAIQMVSTDDLRNARIFTLDGKRIPANKQLSAGVYLIQKNGIVRKASVK